MAAGAIAAASAFASSSDSGGGFTTSQASMLTPVMTGVKVTPILTVGDVIPSGYRFEAIPDGISVRPRGNGRVYLYVNHETSKVPFPYNTANPTAANGENDLDNAQVSQLLLNTRSPPACSTARSQSRAAPATSASARTTSESPDYVFRQENSRPPPLGSPDEKETGLVVALDVKTGRHKPIYGMGRHNHENDVAIPGFDDLVVVSGDDTFTSGALCPTTRASTTTTTSRRGRRRASAGTSSRCRRTSRPVSTRTAPS